MIQLFLQRTKFLSYQSELIGGYYQWTSPLLMVTGNSRRDDTRLVRKHCLGLNVLY